MFFLILPIHPNPFTADGVRSSKLPVRILLCLVMEAARVARAKRASKLFSCMRLCLVAVLLFFAPRSYKVWHTLVSPPRSFTKGGSPLHLYPGEMVISPRDMAGRCKSHIDCQLACQLKLQSPNRSGRCMAVLSLTGRWD